MIMTYLENAFYFMAEKVLNLKTYSKPGLEKIKLTKVISHRGEHNNRDIIENTIPAFDRVVDRVYGIEFDIRWTRDLVPVVFHDENTLRLFAKPVTLQQVTFSYLRETLPQIPTLAEMVERYGKKLHLMIELKHENFPNPTLQNKILSEMLAPLTPVEDYHFLSLTPTDFEIFNFAPKKAYLPIAQVAMRPFSSLTIEKNYGGLTGHYALLNDKIIESHQQHSQLIGTGLLPPNQNLLFREINRDVHWIFSNHALILQNWINELCH